MYSVSLDMGALVSDHSMRDLIYMSFVATTTTKVLEIIEKLRANSKNSQGRRTWNQQDGCKVAGREVEDVLSRWELPMMVRLQLIISDLPEEVIIAPLHIYRR